MRRRLKAHLQTFEVFVIDQWLPEEYLPKNDCCGGGSLCGYIWNIVGFICIKGFWKMSDAEYVFHNINI